MPPRKRHAQCQICNEKESKYTCPSSGCLVEYCSVSCYKQHKDSTCSPKSTTVEQDDVTVQPDHEPQTRAPDDCDEDINEVPLRPLTSLKWPYVPEESAYPDPLKRDDPKPLQLAQYEAIATSPGVRAALTAHPRLKELLREIDGLVGPAREEALQAALGVSRRDVERGLGGGGGGAEIVSEIEKGRGFVGIDEDERYAMRGLAESIEEAVRRRSRVGLFGLDWDWP